MLMMSKLDDFPIHVNYFPNLLLLFALKKNSSKKRLFVIISYAIISLCSQEKLCEKVDNHNFNGGL